MDRPVYPWAADWDELTLLAYFDQPAAIPDSTDHVQLDAYGLARALLLGVNHAERLPGAGNSFRVRVGPTPSCVPLTAKEVCKRFPIETALERTRTGLVPLVIIFEQDRWIEREYSKYAVQGAFAIVQVDYNDQTGCSVVLEPGSFPFHPDYAHLEAPKDVWTGLECSACHRLVRLDDLTRITCPNCGSSNDHLFSEPRSLAALRPVHRPIIDGYRVDHGAAMLPVGAMRTETNLSDGTVVCSYDLERSGLGGYGRRITLHHVTSREGHGSLEKANKALRTMQERRVPMERQRKQDGRRLPFMTHLFGSSPGPCLPASPKDATSWEQADDAILDVLDLITERTASAGVDGPEFTQLLAVNQRVGTTPTRVPVYRPPSSSSSSSPTVLAFLHLGSDVILTFRPRNSTFTPPKMVEMPDVADDVDLPVNEVKPKVSSLPDSTPPLAALASDSSLSSSSGSSSDLSDPTTSPPSSVGTTASSRADSIGPGNTCLKSDTGMLAPPTADIVPVLPLAPIVPSPPPFLPNTTTAIPTTFDLFLARADVDLNEDDLSPDPNTLVLQEVQHGDIVVLVDEGGGEGGLGELEWIVTEEEGEEAEPAGEVGEYYGFVARHVAPCALEPGAEEGTRSPIESAGAVAAGIGTSPPVPHRSP